MNKKLLSLLGALLVGSAFAFCQSYHVDLRGRSEDEPTSVHLTTFSNAPTEALRLPRIDTTGAKFFTLFYSWNIDNDAEVSVMLLRRAANDELHIDLNNNENLTDDGPPLDFAHSRNEIQFDLIGKNDTLQRTTLLLRRRPAVADSMLGRFMLPNGDLNPRFAALWGGMIPDAKLTGERGTFFFDGRLAVRRGVLTIGQESIAIGAFDHSNNGIFNDSDDVVLVDLDGDHLLAAGNESESFARGDGFPAAGRRWEVSSVDRYGRWLDVRENQRAERFRFLKESKRQSSSGTTFGEIEQSFWNLSFKAFDGSTVATANLRGKFLLLNFWGEWCKPCVDEIPDLVQSYKKYPRERVEFIGFLKGNRTKAERLAREKGMTWLQVLLPPDIEEQFGVHGFPTNVLLLPDGKGYVRVIGEVNAEFFEVQMK